MEKEKQQEARKRVEKGERGRGETGEGVGGRGEEVDIYPSTNPKPNNM